MPSIVNNGVSWSMFVCCENCCSILVYFWALKVLSTHLHMCAQCVDGFYIFVDSLPRRYLFYLAYLLTSTLSTTHRPTRTHTHTHWLILTLAISNWMSTHHQFYVQSNNIHWMLLIAWINFKYSMICWYHLDVQWLHQQSTYYQICSQRWIEVCDM